MNNNTINTEVTMRDVAPTGGAKRFHPGDEILGRYVIEAELGQGGMGVVYLCLDKVAGVKVAVKGLPPEVSHNSDEMESVRENFQLVSELQHPNIAGVRTLEVDAATGNYYLIMAYARGSSLKHWMRQHGGKNHRDEQLKILRQIASALDYAHNAEPRHIIHRDIKPENVMVDERGNVSVLDFGLAAQVKSSLSRVSQLVTSRSGTPAYKSPEQWLAQPQRAPSDQYALGVIAYQMYSGELPYDSDDAEILKHAVAFDPVPEIPNEGKDVNAVFAKVLAKKANERFPSCTAFVDALEGKRSADQVRERMRELDRERKIEEEARRQREALQREHALAERKRREELEQAERKRREEAELISLGTEIDKLKQEIKTEHERVSAYLSTHPEYLENRQIAVGLKGLVYEESPKDLSGAREFHKKLEAALLKMKGLISGLDLVVCAAVDGEEVNGATMLYGTRTLDLPVRIKRRQRLSEDDGYLLKYSRGGQEYVGWFSPTLVRQDDGKCVMVPLQKVPTVSAQTKVFILRNCMGYLRTLLAVFAMTVDISAVVSLVAYVCTGNSSFAGICLWTSAVLAFVLLYWRMLRRAVGNVLCGRDDYCVQERSAFSESELLLDRRGQAASKRSRGSADNKDVSYLRIIHKAICSALIVVVFVVVITSWLDWGPGFPLVFGSASAIVAFVVSYRKLMRREMWNALINRDKYKGNVFKQAKIKTGAVVTTVRTDPRPNCTERPHEKCGSGLKWLLFGSGMLLLAAGVVFLVFWLMGGHAGSSSDSAAETSRQRREELRSEIARERRESARMQSLKAETERLAREKRKAEAERIAAEEAARKAREEAERVAAQRRKAEAERKAKEDAERAVAEASQMAIELFKKGNWRSGLKQAEKANQDNAELLFWLGTCYDIGLGADCDAGKALGYFRRAAEKGQVDAQCELGRRYEIGQGVAKDLAQAKRWYQTAASQGSKAAETSLRRVYDLENAAAREASLARERAQKEREDAARKAREAEEAEKVRKLQEELAQLKESTKNVREELATRTVPTSDPTREKFDGTPTMALLKFSSKSARTYYKKAAELARESAKNRAKVKECYETGRECGGPVWPELEAWLNWWK